MNYQEIVKKLYAINIHGGVKLGLDNTQKLNRLLNYPDKKFKSIHIAGTNGKGSVATKIASTLSESGFKTGLYTSPHISTFCERIQIDNKLIPQENVVTGLKRIFLLLERYKIPATFFEVTTMLALDYFAGQNVDFAVLETGLGGRLDATNIITPILSIITSIDFDHMDHLGETLDQIAFEKAGIIKPNVPVILGPKASHVIKYAHNQVIQVEGDFDTYDSENRVIAQKALERLQISNKAIQKGITTKPLCRFEHIKTESGTNIIFDVAHNPSALKILFKEIKSRFPNQNIRVVLGLSQNKEISNCLDVVSKNSHVIHLVEASNGRGVKAADLYNLLKKKTTSVSYYSTVQHGVLDALKRSDPSNEIILVTGSFFIMHNALEVVGNQTLTNETYLNER